MTLPVYLLDGLLVTLAWRVARSRPRHWPVVAWLALVPSCAVARRLLELPLPVERSLYLLPPCSLGALALHSLGRISVLPAVTWWILLSVLVFVARDPAPLYLAAYCGAVGLGCGTISEARPSPPADITTGSVVASVAWAAVDTLGPQAYGDPWRDHSLTEKIALAFLALLCIAHVVHLWTRRRGF